MKFLGLVPAGQAVSRALQDAKRGEGTSVCSRYGKRRHVNEKLTPQRLTMKLRMRWI